MIRRSSLAEVQRLMGSFPAVALIGPRQVGKTTLAHQVAAAIQGAGRPALYLDCERPADAAKLQDADAYLARHADGLVIIDEVQFQAGLFPILRGLIDRDRRPGRFLLLGSAAPSLLRQSAESLAGRIAYIELGGLQWRELDLQPPALDALWLRGGFPLSLTADSDRGSLDWREQFIATYLERDLPAYGVRLPAALTRRFWTMLAHIHGQTLNAADLAAGLGISGGTVRTWLDLLTDLFLVRQIQPWSANTGKRLVKAPKIQLRDSGLVHALLRLETLDDVQGHPICGRSWEGLVSEQLMAALPTGFRPWFYATHAGSEVDLLIESPRGGLIMIEIKRSSAPTISRGLTIAAQDLAPLQRLVVAPVDVAYPMRDGWEALPLAEAIQRAQTGFA